MTGSSRGIGRAAARKLALNGWQVALHGSRESAELDEAAAELGAQCAGVYTADFSDPASADRLMDKVLADGPLYGLVNNAGIYKQLDFARSTEAEFERTFSHIFAANWHAPLRLTRRACVHFLERGGGKVVQVASRVGHRGEAGASAYSASKAALINLARALAVEHAKEGICHYAIAPGWVDTSMARDGMDDRLPEILSGIPLGRMASPDDCAAAIAFLLSPEANYLSGIVIDINGASYLR